MWGLYSNCRPYMMLMMVRCLYIVQQVFCRNPGPGDIINSQCLSCDMCDGIYVQEDVGCRFEFHFSHLFCH